MCTGHTLLSRLSSLCDLLFQPPRDICNIITYFCDASSAENQLLVIVLRSLIIDCSPELPSLKCQRSLKVMVHLQSFSPSHTCLDAKEHAATHTHTTGLKKNPCHLLQQLRPSWWFSQKKAKRGGTNRKKRTKLLLAATACEGTQLDATSSPARAHLHCTLHEFLVNGCHRNHLWVSGWSSGEDMMHPCASCLPPAYPTSHFTGFIVR